MSLLTDELLVARVRAGVVTGLIPPADWFTADSPVGPASVELHIGKIFVPGSAPQAPGSLEQPLTSISLGPGQSVLIASREQVTLPNDLVAIASVPAQLALEGVLVTGIGVLEPGFQGFVHLTVINLSQAPAALAAPMTLLKLHFLLTAAPARKGARDRNPTPLSSLAPIALAKLSSDLLNVDERAAVAARRVIERQGNRLQLWSRFLTALCAVIGIALLVVVMALGWRYAAVDARQQEVEERVRSQDIQRRLGDEIAELQRHVAAMSSIDKPAVPPATTSPTSVAAAALPTTAPATVSSQTQPASQPVSTQPASLPPSTRPATRPATLPSSSD